MEPRNVDDELRQRIRQGKLKQEDVARQLAELAFGRANDCVKLAVLDHPEVDGLDLTMLSEIRRNDKGTVEIKLADRLQALEQLLKLTGENGSELGAFLAAMQGGVGE